MVPLTLAEGLFKLLLGSQLVSMATLLLAAVGSARRETSIAPDDMDEVRESSHRSLLSADLLFTVELLRKESQGGVEHTSFQTEHQLESGVGLNAVVTDIASVVKRLPIEHEHLHRGGDVVIGLDHLFHIGYRAGGVYRERPRGATEGPHEDLHGWPVRAEVQVVGPSIAWEVSAAQASVF